MSRTNFEKIIIAVISPLLVAAVLSFTTNIGNSASKDDLNTVKTEAKQYTDDKMIDHEKREALVYSNFSSTLMELKDQVQYMYLRDLKQADEKLYLRELERIKSKGVNSSD